MYGTDNDCLHAVVILRLSQNVAKKSIAPCVQFIPDSDFHTQIWCRCRIQYNMADLSNAIENVSEPKSILF